MSIAKYIKLLIETDQELEKVKEVKLPEAQKKAKKAEKNSKEE